MGFSLEGVRLTHANGFPALSNSGSNRNFGFWPDVASYNAVLVDSGAGPKVSSYAGSAFNIDYATGFPPIGSGNPVRSCHHSPKSKTLLKPICL